MLGANTWALLRNRQFLRIWIGQFGSNFGDWFASIALVTYVYQVTQSSTAVAGLLLAYTLPTVIFSPLAGVVSDRWNRRRIMIACDLLRVAAVTILVWHDSLPCIYALAFIGGAAGAFFLPALRASIPNVVEEDQLAGANGLLSATYNLTLAIGPSLAGVLVAAAGWKLALWLDAASFLWSALLLLGLKLPEVVAAEEKSEEPWLENLLQGFRYVATEKSALVVITSLFIVIATAGSLDAVEVVFTNKVLKSGPEGYGFLVGAWGAGMLIGSLFTPWLLRRWSLEQAFLRGFLLNGLGLLFTGVSPILALALGWYTLGGWGSGVSNVAMNTLLQKQTPNSMQGRIFSFVGMSTTVAYMLAVMLGGWAATWITPRIMYVLAAGGCLAGWAWGYSILHGLSPVATLNFIANRQQRREGERDPELDR